VDVGDMASNVSKRSRARSMVSTRQSVNMITQKELEEKIKALTGGNKGLGMSEG